MAEVRLRNIHKGFGETRVLKGVDVTIPDTGFVVIVGPSGCGKSTLLRLIAGLETADDGEVLIGGEEVSALDPGARDVAMVFQNYALYPHLTVAENIGFGLSVRGMPKAEIKQRVQAAAESLQIANLLDRRPRQLSGGQRQRVAMGRAVVRNPKVFLFDEPLSNLDAKLRVTMRTEIKRLHRHLTATSVYVTHDQVEAMTLGDRLVVMNNGVVEQEGAPLDIYMKPASAFVAGFIGSPPINLLDGWRVTNGIGITEQAVIAYPRTDDLPEKMQAGIRPEHILPCAESEAQIRLVAEVVEPQGAETIVHGLADGLKLTVRLDGAQRIAEGEALPLRVDPAALHLFDCETGRRLSL
ncbi:MAG TPA: sn-glycerol-3-phosphate ABC transporter ATP-binding protein UgpC [Terriglobales bacterium]|nr:sn-glycerol-3-phosphate ABC transporter ATP-binding protein UgpC [Terriglobales bacterium]